MIDRPDRPLPRFPAAKAEAAARLIAETLTALDAGPNDVAFAQGAAGGDLLFAECCQARGVDLHLLLPQPESDFVAASVLPSTDGEAWHRRYLAVRERLDQPPEILPTGTDQPYSACNRWLLERALAWGVERLHLICLWDGENGDGDGGTADMVDAVRRRGGRITWLDTRQL
jgi:hypothetical protein